MNSCYYCGNNALLICDAFVPSEPNFMCGRFVCTEHAVPEFVDGDIEQFTLCKDHADLQKESGNRS
jgi:hypothetical protein